MESRAHALVAGLFALILGAAAVLAVWWFSGQGESTRDYELITTGSITGLNVQAPVRYRGMAAGKVTDIRIDPDDKRLLVVAIRIRSDLPITMGTRASMGYQGVTGLAFVQLDDRGADPRPLQIVDGRVARLTLESGLLDTVSDVMVDALQRFRTLADQMNDFFGGESAQRFVRILERLESVALGMDETFKEGGNTLIAIRSAFSRENIANLNRLMTRLDQASAEAAPAFREGRALLVQMRETLARIDHLTESTGAKLNERTLPELEALLAELNDTTRRIGRLTAELDKTPQMLITGRGERVPGPGEHGFEAAR